MRAKGLTDGQTYIMELVVVLRNFANASKKKGTQLCIYKPKHVVGFV